MKTLLMQSLKFALVAMFALLPHTAFAADGYQVVHWGNFNKPNGATDVVSADWVTTGHVPVNNDSVFVYDPDFYFYLTGSTTGRNRVAEFANKGFVIVAAAG